MVEMAEGARFYFDRNLEYDEKGREKLLEPAVPELLGGVREALPGVEGFSQQGIESFLKEFCAGKGIKLGQIGPAIRVALCGTTAAPGIGEVMETLGRDETLARLDRALAWRASEHPSP
jgi:glutamyl-tRNA synthetase